MTRLGGFLRRHRRIALDTNIFIYVLEESPRYSDLADFVLGAIESGHPAVTSTITMTEVLVQPYRLRDEERVDAIFALLSTYRNLEWVSPDLEIADLAARFRALHRLRTPDALQAATAARAEASGFLTNDPAFQRVDAFETLLFDDLLG